MPYIFQDSELEDGEIYNFTNLLVDEYGNTHYPGPMVIKARVEVHPEYGPDTWGSIPTLHVIEPGGFDWPTVKATYFVRTRPELRPGDINWSLYLDLITEVVNERGLPGDTWMIEVAKERADWAKEHKKGQR